MDRVALLVNPSVDGVGVSILNPCSTICITGSVGTVFEITYGKRIGGC
jgi:hypothetical protein